MADDQALRSSQLFAGVPADVVQDAIASGTRVRVKRGSCFYQSDETAKRLFILVSGLVKLRMLTPTGYRILFRFIRPGEFFGYQSVLNNSGRYFTTSEVAVDSEALCWSRTAIRRLLQSHPGIAMNALSISLTRMQDYQERLAEMASAPVPARIARRLLRLESGAWGKSGPVTINGEFTREDLAGLAGSTLHTVSRILARWERAHIVEKWRGAVRILEHAKLAQIAGI